MRPELLDPELRRDLAGRTRRGRIAAAPHRPPTPEELARRAGPVPVEFVTSPDGGGRRRLLARFGLANRLRRAS